MTKKQIFKLILSLFAVALVLCAVVLGFTASKLPENLRVLPLPLVVIAVAILLVLKTTGKSLDTVIPPSDPESGDSPKTLPAEPQADSEKDKLSESEDSPPESSAEKEDK